MEASVNWNIEHHSHFIDLISNPFVLLLPIKLKYKFKKKKKKRLATALSNAFHFTACNACENKYPTTCNQIIGNHANIYYFIGFICSINCFLAKKVFAKIISFFFVVVVHCMREHVLVFVHMLKDAFFHTDCTQFRCMKNSENNKITCYLVHMLNE